MECRSEITAVFSDPSEPLPFNTKIVATVRTINNEPVYSKFYPCQIEVTEFANK